MRSAQVFSNIVHNKKDAGFCLVLSMLSLQVLFSNFKVYTSGLEHTKCVSRGLIVCMLACQSIFIFQWIRTSHLTPSTLLLQSTLKSASLSKMSSDLLTKMLYNTFMYLCVFVCVCGFFSCVHMCVRECVCVCGWPFAYIVRTDSSISA